MKSKIAKKNSFSDWSGVIICFLLCLFGMCAWIWITWKTPTSIMQPILFLVMLIVIFYCDNSGIRLSIINKIPTKAPFYKCFAKKCKNGDRRTQFYKTLTYLSLLLLWISTYISFIFTAAAIIFPVLAIYRYIRYNDRISFSGETKNDLSPTVAAMLAPSFLFAIWGFHNHEYSTLFWSLLIAIPIIFIVPFFIFTKEYRKKITIALGFSFCIIFFTFGSLCNINSSFDFSKPRGYWVSIVDKYVTSGKAQTLYVTVTPWDNQKENVDIEVDKESYKSAISGQKVIVVQHKGALNMSWYYLIVNSSTE